MKQVLKTLIPLVGLVLSGAAFATPGHDHGVWTSAFIHAAWVLPLVGIVLFSAKGLRAYFKGDK